MPKRVVVDPVTRIEGHLRVEVVVDETNKTVKDAISSANFHYFYGLTRMGFFYSL